jgi:hypothetical protein
MDSTLFSCYANAMLASGSENWIGSRKHSGIALVVVHPDGISFDHRSNASNDPAALHREFLTWASTKYAAAYWNAVPAEVAKFIKPLRCERQTHTQPS